MVTNANKTKQKKIVSLIDEWEHRKNAGQGYINMFGMGDPEEDALKAVLRKNADIFNATILDELAKSGLADIAFEHVAAHPGQATSTVMGHLSQKLDRLQFDRSGYSDAELPLVRTLKAVADHNPAALTEDALKGVLNLLCFLDPVTTDEGYPCDRGFEGLKHEAKAAFDKIMEHRLELFSPLVMGDLQWSWQHRVKEEYFPFHDVQCPFGASQGKSYGSSVGDILNDLFRISGVTQDQIGQAFAQRMNSNSFFSGKAQAPDRHEAKFKRLLKNLE